MSKGPLAIFGHWTSASKNSIETYTNLYNVPFLSWSPTIYKHETNEENLEKEAFVQQASVENHDGEFSSEHNYMNSLQANLNQIHNTNGDHLANEIADTPSFQVNFHPDLVPLLISLIKYNRWKTIYYIYNHEEGN
jgi:hypothetical protein